MAEKNGTTRYVNIRVPVELYEIIYERAEKEALIGRRPNVSATIIGMIDKLLKIEDLSKPH